MMRMQLTCVVRSTLMGIVLATVATSNAVAQDGFDSLFNGKDLSGWSGDPELWTVEDGAITGRTKGPDHLKYNKFLILEGKPFENFILRVKFRLEGNNNSGVQYRSVQLKDAGDWVVKGYQADIHSKPEYTGMLYDERGRGILAQRGQKVTVTATGEKSVKTVEEKPAEIDLSEWHELEIFAAGNRLIHRIDGQVTVDVSDEQTSEAESKGIIALQVHRGPAMVAQFKDIRIRRLPPSPQSINVNSGNDQSSTSPERSKGNVQTPKKPQTTPAGAKIEGQAVAQNKKVPRKAAGNSKKKVAAPRPEAVTPQWVWYKPDGQLAQRVFFRKEMTIRGAIGAARLFAACDNEMTVYFDGQKVLESGSWDQPEFANIAALLEKETPGNKHVLAVEGVNIGENNPAGLLVRLDFDSGWRDAWSVVTDSSWKVSTSAGEGWLNAGFDDSQWDAAEVITAIGGAPWTSLTPERLAAAARLKEPTATPAESLKVASGFKVDLLYSVPKGVQGSWVNMCVDPKGRLIVSDQYGGLYRVTLPPVDSTDEIKLEKINVDIGEAQGLLWAFDSLYVVVNRGQKYASGLYRVRDTDGDDQLDQLETLRTLDGGGEHGPHAILLTPDRKGLYVVCGNGTQLTEIDSSRVPQVWDEDLLLPRAYGRGFMRGKRAPGGYISRIDPDGKKWELVATGFRNEFDAALNSAGDLFTYDADMEWDMNTPWYRPTRICHVVSGAEFGWRNGGGKWPVHYPDSVPPVVDVGPGSPTGICFGTGADFPQRYQQALFASDWSYGKLYAVHLVPQGGSYAATLEEFITGTPLPLTDVVINPHDGAMYFAIGGRRVQSGLYRVTWDGTTEPEPRPVPGSPTIAADPQAGERHKLRRSLEELHHGDHPDAVKKAWPYLGHEDRAIRFAARIAIEHRPISEWQEQALTEADPTAALNALMALARQIPRTDRGDGPDIDTPPARFPATDQDRHPLLEPLLMATAKFSFPDLNHPQRIALMRVLTLTFVRAGSPTDAMRDALIRRFDPVFPCDDPVVDFELAQLMVYLQADSAAGKVVTLLKNAPTQEQQIDLARTLRHLRRGWNRDLQQDYFSWFVQAMNYRGGASFSLFVENIKKDAVAMLTDDDRQALAKVLNAKPQSITGPIAAPREFVREWKFEELVPIVQNGLHGRDFERGRQLFGAANCFACHRFDNQGGAVGPDLTALAGRFSSRDILESIVNPSKVISDQYAAVSIVTIDGKVITGRIVNLAGNSIRVNTNMLDPDAQVGVDRQQIEEIVPSPTSMMPVGLLNTLNEDEILDLMAYLMSRGDRNANYFKN